MSETGLKNISIKRDRDHVVAVQVCVQWKGQRRYGRIEVASPHELPQAIREARMLRDDFERELRKPRTERIVRAVAAIQPEGRRCLGLSIDRTRHNVVVTWAPVAGKKRHRCFGYRRCGLDVAWSRAIEFRQAMEAKHYGGKLSGCIVKGAA